MNEDVGGVYFGLLGGGEGLFEQEMVRRLRGERVIVKCCDREWWEQEER